MQKYKSFQFDLQWCHSLSKSENKPCAIRITGECLYDGNLSYNNVHYELRDTTTFDEYMQWQEDNGQIGLGYVIDQHIIKILDLSGNNADNIQMTVAA